ncbi:MAG: hypothetical protein NZM12_13440, partial [Steroidobacteraceae bacterium]|nr:hypothetical protein [Steroidobacteraceae bacterium]MDW8259825.1 hypothetical protein [Gammaproteobacteria bacterium]
TLSCFDFPVSETISIGPTGAFYSYSVGSADVSGTAVGGELQWLASSHFIDTLLAFRHLPFLLLLGRGKRDFSLWHIDEFYFRISIVLGQI